MPHYALQPRRHQHEGRAAVQEGPDGPRPPSDFAVDAPDPVVRPDLASVLRREFRVGQRLGEPVVHRPLVALCPDELGRRFVELRVERLLVDRYDVRRKAEISTLRSVRMAIGRLRVGSKSRFLRYDDAERGNKAWSTHLLQSGVGVDHPSSRRQNPRKGFPWTRPLPAEGLRNRFHSDSGSVIACPLSLNRLQHCGELRA